jgi:hypothetical protein
VHRGQPRAVNQCEDVTGFSVPRLSRVAATANGGVLASDKNNAGNRTRSRRSIVSENPHQIATAYVDRWQKLWNEQGGISALYTADSVLVGFRTAVGKTDIAALLQSIRDQGWTGIAIKVVNARAIVARI